MTKVKKLNKISTFLLRVNCVACSQSSLLSISTYYPRRLCVSEWEIELLHASLQYRIDLRIPNFRLIEYKMKAKKDGTWKIEKKERNKETTLFVPLSVDGACWFLSTDNVCTFRLQFLTVG